MTPRRWVWHYLGLGLVCVGVIVSSASSSIPWTAALCLGGLFVQYLSVRPMIRAFHNREDPPSHES